LNRDEPNVDGLWGALPKGRVILVEGNPGSGKTILSTQFLYDGAMDHREKGMYVSFFEDADKFKRNASSLGLDFRLLERKKFFKIIHCTTMTSKGMKDSIRDIMQAIFDFRPQRLVFDSISSVLQVMGHDETRAFLQTIFQSFMKRYPMTTLLVGEIPFGDGHTVDGISEFFADGIIRLERSHQLGSHLRTLAILKMRGMRISDPLRFFTLEGGFHLIKRPIPIPKISKPELWKPVKDSESSFSAGSKDLDSLLGGGYPKGQYAVLETDPNVPIEMIRLFQFQLAWNFLSQERGVLILPTLGATSTELKNLMTKHIPVETFERYVRIFERVRSISRLNMGQQPPYVISTKHDNPIENTEELLNQTCLDLIRETGKPVARLIGFPALENIYAGRQEMLYTFIGEAVAQNKLEGNFSLAVSRSDVELTQRVLNIVDWHLRLIERNGYEFLRVVKPIPTEFFAVDTDVADGTPKLKLTPMV